AAGSVGVMRRTSLLLAATALALAACGGSDDADAGGDNAAATTESTTEATTDSASEPAGDDDVAGDDAGSDDGSEDSSEDSGDGTATAATEPEPVEKPEVEVPGEAPAELVRTVLIDGEGPEAEIGDVVVVDYVGVRSLDGEEFDNSYDRGDPFPVTLGSNSVIQGWEQGLIGARAGDRLQLDIPSDLAYGASARGDVIRENEALTFVIDVREVIDRPDPADAPGEPGVELVETATETTFETLSEGDGDELADGALITFHYVLFRGDNGVQLESSWVAQPPQIPFDDNLFPGLMDGMAGMQVGERRAITMPASESPFGVEGNPQAGLPADTPSIWVIDLLDVG
ncbi:MAG: FKBP-type peptidyl-prolyl cis-trans isomerase, partial [Actinomycetota bacterium]